MKTFKTTNPENNEILKNISKDNIFKVPENYFDTLPQIISENCKAHNNINLSRIFVFRPRFYFPAIAVITLFMISFLLIKNYNVKNGIITEKVQLASIIDEYSYLEQLIDNNELEESEIIEAITYDDSSKQVIPVIIDPGALKNAMIRNSCDSTIITSDDIIEYLLEDEELSDDPYNNF